MWHFFRQCRRMDMYFNKTKLKAYRLLQKTGIRGRILLQTLIVPSSAQKYFRRLENPQYFILYTRSWHRIHLEPNSKTVRISSPYERFIFMLPSNLRQYISTFNIQASCDVELGPPLSTDVSKGLTTFIFFLDWFSLKKKASWFSDSSGHYSLFIT